VERVAFTAAITLPGFAADLPAYREQVGRCQLMLVDTSWLN
jgi:hypothetical protein